MSIGSLQERFEIRYKHRSREVHWYHGAQPSHREPAVCKRRGQKPVTARKSVAFRTPPFNRHLIGSQVYCLVLTIVLVAFPMTGPKPQDAPILIPMSTEPVPLDSGFQSPPASPFELPSFLAPGRMVLGPRPPSPALAPDLHFDSLLYISSLGYCNHRATDRPSGRSPPPA